MTGPTVADGGGLVHHSATELSAMIADLQVSCVAVMEAHLDQIERLNPVLNAIVGMRDRSDLLAEARQRDAELASGHSRGWMHGLPHAVKDLAAAKGLPFTCGSPIYADRVAEADDLVVQRIRDAGAILVGKTNTPEFGLGSQTYNPVWGVTATPYDTTRTSGGSSGGAASALAARMLPVADGSDHMGSLRNPAAFNNVVGFRPSWGRVPTPGFVAYGSVSGPMGRTVTDVARLLATMSGPDSGSPLGMADDPAALSHDLDRDIRGLRVAWVGDWDGYLATEPGILPLCEDALKVLEDLGCHVEPTVPTFAPERIWDLFVTWRSWSLLWLADLYDDPAARTLMKPELVWEIERGLSLTARDVTRAWQEQIEWYAAASGLFATYDVVVAPSAQVFPFDKTVHWPSTIAGRPMDTYHRWMETVAAWTMTGHPVAAMPAGFDARGLPTGIQIIGRQHADHAVLQVARAYERATGWVQRVPPSP